MFDPPITLKEARAYRYTQWGGNPKGNDYNPAHCAYSICGQERGALPCQCSRKNGHGPAGLYCKQHSKAVLESCKRTVSWIGGRGKLSASEKKQVKQAKKIIAELEPKI